MCGYTKSGSPWRRKSKSRLICAVQQITVKRIDYGFPPPTICTANIIIVLNEMSCWLYNRILLTTGNVLCKRFHHTSTASHDILHHDLSLFHFLLPFPFPAHLIQFCIYSIHSPTLRKYGDRVNANTPRYFIFTGYKAG